MEVVFEVVDPRGKQVICTEYCWIDHILSNRPFMVGLESEVKVTIQKPTFGIYEDANRAERNIYYRLFSGKERYMKVVVSFSDKDGTVITAFPTNNMKSGEKLIWTASSQ